MKTKKSKNVHTRTTYTPVVTCKLNSRQLLCGKDTNTQGVAISVAYPQKVDIERMAIDINHATTATDTDVKLVWDALRQEITEALSHGHRVQLDGLGTLTMELSSHTGPTAPTGKDVRISAIRFRPDKHLLDRLADVKFRVEGKVRQPLAAPELADALYEYFETHDDISTREFARISHYAMSTSYRKIRNTSPSANWSPYHAPRATTAPPQGILGSKLRVDGQWLRVSDFVTETRFP